MKTTYDVTLRMTGAVQDFKYVFDSETEARDRFFELSHREDKPTLVELVLTKTVSIELGRWQAPGYPF